MLVFNNGGNMNGTTNEDRTNYFEVLPANQLDLALFLEADRMKSLAITKENLDNQRNAVQEERRLGVDNQPYGKSGEVQQELIYDNFAYKHSVIGSMDDLNAATVEDVSRSSRCTTHQTTQCSCWSVTSKLLKPSRRFAPTRGHSTPTGSADSRHDRAARKKQNDARVLTTLARAPRVDLGAAATPDFYALQVLGAVLQSGQSSRLYQKLVKEKEMVSGVGGFMDEKRGVGAFYTNATLRPNVKTEDVEATIYAEIDRLKKEPIADWELQKAKNTTRRKPDQRSAKLTLRAITIGQYTTYYNEPNLINERLDKVAAVTKEDVQRVANKYLVDTNRTVVITMPKAKAKAQPAHRDSKGVTAMRMIRLEATLSSH